MSKKPSFQLSEPSILFMYDVYDKDPSKRKKHSPSPPWLHWLATKNKEGQIHELVHFCPPHPPQGHTHEYHLDEFNMQNPKNYDLIKLLKSLENLEQKNQSCQPLPLETWTLYKKLQHGKLQDRDYESTRFRKFYYSS